MSLGDWHGCAPRGGSSTEYSWGILDTDRGHVWRIAVTVGGIDGDNGGENNGWRALRGIRMGREDVRVEAMGAYSVLLVTVICLRHTSRGDLKTGGWGVARQPSEGDPVTEMTGAGLVIT